MAERPNVLIFCVDEMRADHLGCAGNPLVRTPHLDALAAAGTRFDRACVNNPICMPARLTMFSGLMPRDHGVRVNGQEMHAGVPLLPQVLADAGYRTHAAGKLHLTPWMPKVEPPDITRYPECLDYWRREDVTTFPEPYCGFDSVDFVGGHTSFIYGEYVQWLRERGGDLSQIGPPAGSAGSRYTYRMTVDEELHYNRYIADSAIGTIADAAAGDAPFFVWCSFPDPHMPVAAPAPYSEMVDPASIPLPPRRAGELTDLPPFYADVFSGALRPNGIDNTDVSDRDGQEIIAMTYGMVTHVDTEVGRVLAARDAAGVRENTLIIFTSDHGDMMGDHGLLWKAFYTFQGCLRVPLIVAAPGAPAGRVCPTLTAQIDLMPSILDICGVPMPGAGWEARETPFDRGVIRPLATYPGQSWQRLLSDEPPARSRPVVVENDDPCTGLQPRALVTDRHRLTIYPGTEHGELFDLLTDPHELENLWYRSDAAALRTELSATLLDAYASSTPSYPVPPWNS
jgi:arylsulfatase A-like enzyme